MTREGFAFVIIEGEEEDVFVRASKTRGALNGDTVRVAVTREGTSRDRGGHESRREGEVVEIIERSSKPFVGIYHVAGTSAWVLMQSRNMPYDIEVDPEEAERMGAQPGYKVSVLVDRWARRDNCPKGHLVDVLGEPGNNDTEMHAILAQYGLPYSYPKNVEDAANRIPAEITAEDYAEREDFRDVFTCTIDPHDAKDFDDALSLRKLDDGAYEVGVHIADVSHYVKEGSVIDKEAQKRATSIYLVDRTIPMLPERLCNFICSLRPDEEKLAYSVIFKMTPEADITDWRLVHTVIKSSRRFTYEEAQARIEGEDGDYKDEINTLWALAKQLREKRFQNGAVNFDREEMRFEIDSEGKPVRCYFKVSKEANKLVEEFMLLANRTVAESVGKVKKGQKAKVLPYRVHDVPDPTKLETLRDFIVRFGYKLKTAGTKGAVTKSLNKLLADCNGKKEQKLIQTVALRAMMKAKYTTHNIGHYGLAFDYYTHFTSPIRRYPDTMVHRLLTRYQKGGRSASEKKYEELCEHSSDMEILAQQAERDSIKYKMVEFMGKFLGQEYDAHISGITAYGIYCEIDENHCEGMVPMRDLNDDYYDFDERNYCLRGRRRHNIYSLGDSVRIKVARANVEKRQLDFEIVQDMPKQKKK